MSAEDPAPKKVNLTYVSLESPLTIFSAANWLSSDPSGAEQHEVSLNSSGNGDDNHGDSNTDSSLQELDTSTAILKKKKKPNSLM